MEVFKVITHDEEWIVSESQLARCLFQLREEEEILVLSSNYEIIVTAFYGVIDKCMDLNLQDKLLQELMLYQIGEKEHSLLSTYIVRIDDRVPEAFYVLADSLEEARDIFKHFCKCDSANIEKIV